MTTTQLPVQISASIHRDAILRVPDFFNATLEDIFTELLQNSRRAGASGVDISWNGETVTLKDDGCGISDPAVLLAFGNSQWQEPLIIAENPAGMGIYSLARRTVIVESRPAHGPGWTVNLEPRHFTGQEPADVTSAPSHPQGTSIAFTHSSGPKDALTKTCRYFPLPVTYNGAEMERHPFTANAVHLEEWQGITLAVHRHTRRCPRLNFHGVTLQTKVLPSVPDLQDHWIVDADVKNCPQLRLTLPARKELVVTPFLEDLTHAGYAAIYHAMLAHHEPVDVPYAVQQHALSLGIRLPDARPRLRPWQAAQADDNACDPLPQRQALPEAPLVMDCEPPIPDQTALDRRAGGTSLEQRLFAANEDLAGYGWYDALTKIAGLSITAEFEDGPASITSSTRRGRDRSNLPSQRPDSITLTLHCNDPFRGPHTLDLDTDLAFLPDSPSEYIDDRTAVVTKHSEITPYALAEALERAYFEPSYEGDADAYDTQADTFRTDAMRSARRLLQTPEEALTHAIRAAVREAALPELPAGMNATIVIRRDHGTQERGDIAVILHQPPEQTQPDTASEPQP